MKIKEVFSRYREVLMYLLFGVLTTAVDLGVYTPLTVLIDAETKFLGISWHLYAQVIAWVAAVLFAFVTNKIWVFSSPDFSPRAIARELPAFAGGRVLTLLIQLALMWLLIDLCALHTLPLLVWASGIIGAKGDFAVRMGVSVIVIVLNYVFSKLFVFKKH